MSKDEITPLDTGQVLRRAIELDRIVGGELDDETLDHKALAEIAAEVGVSPAALAAAVADDGLLIAEGHPVTRLVTHLDVSADDVETTIEIVAKHLAR